MKTYIFNGHNRFHFSYLSVQLSKSHGTHRKYVMHNIIKMYSIITRIGSQDAFKENSYCAFSILVSILNISQVSLYFHNQGGQVNTKRHLLSEHNIEHGIFLQGYSTLNYYDKRKKFWNKFHESYFRTWFSFFPLHRKNEFILYN